MCLFVAVLALCGCGGENAALRERVENAAARLNLALVQARMAVIGLRDDAQRLLSDPEKRASAGMPDPQTHRFFGSKGVYFKHVDDGGCGVWASGFTPVGPEVLAMIALAETLEPEIAGLVKNGGLIAQSYMLFTSNFGIFFPYLDSAAIFPPGVDFSETYAPFYEAAPTPNPERKEIWLEPYLDATGKGFMTSVSSPIYAKNRFQGVAGGDIAAGDVKEAFLDPERMQMVLTGSLIPLAATKPCAALLGLHDLSAYRYMEGVTKDRYASEGFDLLHVGRDVFRLGKRLEQERAFTWTAGNRAYDVFAAPVPETGWLLVELIEK